MDIESNVEIAAKYIQEGKLVAFPTERVYKLAENFWPGPLTIVLPKSNYQT